MVTENLSRAFASTRGVLSNVKADQFDDPTPCTSWAVRDLINHIVGGTYYFAATTETGEFAPPTEKDWSAGDILGSFDEGVARAVAAFGADGAQEKTITLP